jgi:hypothetical protein
MSWHTSAILIRSESPPDHVLLLGQLGFPGATEIGPIDFEEATSIGIFDTLGDRLGAAVASVDGWISIWGPLLVADSDAVADLSRGGAALTLILEGASGTAGFEWFRDGTLLRRWLVQGGDFIHDEGDPLAEESAASTYDPEGRVLFLLERLAVPLMRLDAAAYTLYSLPE